MTGWRYWYRRRLGWIPIQPCMMCGKWYWGSLPRWWFWPSKHHVGLERRRWRQTWQASWKEFCSAKCNEESLEML